VWRDPLNIQNQPHQNESDHNDANRNQYRHWRRAISTPLAAHDRRARARPNPTWFWRRLILQIRITVDRHLLRRFEHVEIRANIDIEKLSVDLQKPFRISEARKLRKIVGFNLGQTRRTDLGQAGGFIQREAAGQSCILKFLAQTFNCHDG
jgi:hypothetical protein